MFTLKFYDGLPGGTTVVACPRYSVHPNQFNSGVTVHAFPTLGPSGECEFGVLPPSTPYSQNDFSHCFVENSAGKTIDRIGPFDSVPTHNNR